MHALRKDSTAEVGKLTTRRHGMTNEHGGESDQPDCKNRVTITLAKSERTVRSKRIGPIRVSKQFDDRGRLQIVLEGDGLEIEGFGKSNLTPPADVA